MKILASMHMHEADVGTEYLPRVMVCVCFSNDHLFACTPAGKWSAEEDYGCSECVVNLTSRMLQRWSVGTRLDLSGRRD